jgi:DNA-binding NtrC family response regulator
LKTSADLLLVENDMRIVELLTGFLQRRGHTVRSASSYAQARECIVERRPDLLLSDVDLGRESARTMLPKLSGEGLLPPTWVVSGYVDRELSSELLAIPGVLGVLAKPFEFARLERLIADFLARGNGATVGADARATSASRKL